MSHTPITVLSVDWDYFLPCSIDGFDRGHSEESSFFYELVWPLRALNRPWVPRKTESKTAHELIQVDPKRVAAFWDSVLAPGYPYSSCIVDSHKDIVEFLSQLRGYEVINFDAHHDCGYTVAGKHERVKHLNCGNWSRYLREKNRMLKYTLVYPDWRRKAPENCLPEGIDRIIYGDWPTRPIKAEIVFLCRSSCWMPSWCDQQWLQLTDALRARQPFNEPCGCDYVKKARPFEPAELRV